MKIRIKTTNRVVPRSRHIVFLSDKAQAETMAFRHYFGYPLVTDLSVGLENPLDTISQDWYPISNGKLTGVTRHKALADELNKPEQPLHKRLTKLFKRRNK